MSYSRAVRITLVQDFRGYRIRVWQDLPHKLGENHVLAGQDVMTVNPEIALAVFATVTGEGQVITPEQIGRAIEAIPDVVAYEITTPFGAGVMVDSIDR